MAKKLKPWPKCVAPLCDKEADKRLHLEGQNGVFQGALCYMHSDLMQYAFPSQFTSIADLRPHFISLLCKKCEKEIK
jgi:hypothetical protein